MGVYRRTISKGGKKRVSRNWYCVDPLTGRERSLKVTDKSIAEIMLGELRRQRELRRAGIEDFGAARRLAPMPLVEAFLVERCRGLAHNTQRAWRQRLTDVLGK